MVKGQRWEIGASISWREPLWIFSWIWIDFISRIFPRKKWGMGPNIPCLRSLSLVDFGFNNNVFTQKYTRSNNPPRITVNKLKLIFLDFLFASLLLCVFFPCLLTSSVLIYAFPEEEDTWNELDFISYCSRSICHYGIVRPMNLIILCLN